MRADNRVACSIDGPGHQTDRTGLAEVSDLFLTNEKGMVQFRSPFGRKDVTSPYFTQLNSQVR